MPPIQSSGDGPAKLDQAAAVRIAGLASAQCGHAGVHGFRRRRDPGLAHPEVDHPGALALHGEGALHDLHGQERLELIDPGMELQGHGLSRVAATFAAVDYPGLSLRLRVSFRPRGRC